MLCCDLFIFPICEVSPVEIFALTGGAGLWVESKITNLYNWRAANHDGQKVNAWHVLSITLFVM